jgi:hypothetical protein
MTFSKEDIIACKKELLETAQHYTTRPVQTEWITEEAVYHNVVGIIDHEMQLMVCDYDGKFLVPRNRTLNHGCIVSIRISNWLGDTPHHANPRSDVIPTADHLTYENCSSCGASTNSALGADSSSPRVPSAPPLPDVANWNGVPVEFNVWVDIRENEQMQALSPQDQVAVLGSVYAPSLPLLPLPEPQSCARAATTATTTAAAAAAVDDLTTPLSESSDSATAFTTVTATAASASAATATVTTVVITGVHMGYNPCSGVGVARSIRAAVPAARIIGADECKFSDPAFSAFHSVDELGSTGSSVGATKQLQWDIVLSLLHDAHTHTHTADHDADRANCGLSQLFYYPVRTISLQTILSSLYSFS